MMDIESRIYDSRDDVKKLILSVINGEVKEVELPFKPLEYYDELIESLGYVQCDWDTNGWQVDFWQYFDKEDNGKGLFCFEGSLWAGEFKFRTLYKGERE